jgi:AcrR family transcriptional regulator
MAAVRELLAEGTFHQASVEQVAERAGVSRATVYLHFRSRVDLVDAMCDTFDANPALIELRDAVELDDADAALAETIALAMRFWASEDAILSELYGAAALDPAARELDEGRRFPICRPEPLVALLREAGLTEVESRPIDVPTVFRDFDDYWSPFLGGQGPAPGYAMSLDEPRRAALRERIRAGLPVEVGGSIHLVARAWAVRGTKPA